MGRDKRLRLQQLREEGVTLHAKIPLKKTEGAIVRNYAESRFNPGRFGKPQIGQAVATLLRVAFNCLREHRDRYQDETPITLSAAQQAGLRTPGRANVRYAKGSKRPGEAKKLPDDP